jgi:hypothetical protein
MVRARAQGAFVFWNHPGFRVPAAEWFPAIAAAHEQNLFDGMELVNGPQFYPEAFPWIAAKRLTILCNSDAHEPTPPRARGGVRPMTLIFARTRDAEGVREALVSRRTVAWMGGELWGAAEYLRGLWSGAVRFDAPRVKAGTFGYLIAQLVRASVSIRRTAIAVVAARRAGEDSARRGVAAARPHHRRCTGGRGIRRHRDRNHQHAP